MFKKLLISIFIFGAGLFLATLSFAQEAKTLNEAAAALQKINPALSQDLYKFANEEENEIEGQGEGKEEAEGQAENDREEHHQGHIKLLKDSAAILEKSNPDLAKKLIEMASKKHEEHEGKDDTKEVEENEIKSTK